MRLTRLEIFGFKSFVERFSLHFDQNLIGIVGPNGCGKSNVVDALRWVLGETHAKQLRGGKQEDLIFNGSEARRALGMAEVSITIRPSDAWASRAFAQEDELERLLLVDSDEQAESERSKETAVGNARDDSLASGSPTAEGKITKDAVLMENTAAVSVANAHAHVQQTTTFLSELPELLKASEIQFTRRLYRSGESEYMINRVPCRLRDMIEIYRYIGLGSRGLNIVQQGQIGELISKKPVERRELLEEAAGISGFRAKLEAAQRKLSKTNDNLSRIRDIEIEVDKQVKVLKRQATRAKMRNELKSELERIELDWYSQRAAQVVARKTAAAAECAQLEDASESAQAKLAEADAQFVESQAQLESQDQSLFELRRQRDHWANQLRQERERLQSLEKDVIRCETEQQSIEGQRLDLDERETRIVDETARRQEEKAEAEAELEEFTSQRAIAEEDLERRREEVAQEIAQIEHQIANRLAQSETESQGESIDSLQQEIQALEQSVDSTSNVEQELRSCRQEIAKLRQRIQGVLVAQASLQAERQTLEAQAQRAAEHVVRATTAEQSGEILSTLAAGLVIPEDCQRAVQAVLGDKGSFVVSPSALELGWQFTAKEAEQKNVCIGVLDNSATANTRQSLTERERVSAPSAQFLLDCISVDERVGGAAATLLEGVVLVDSLAEALALRECAREQGSARGVIVSRAGEVVHEWGWFTTSGSGADFSFGRRLEEIREAVRASESEQSTLETELEALQTQETTLLAESERRSTIRQQAGELRKQLSESLQRERRERESMQQEIRREEKRLRDAAMEKERVAQQQVQQLAGEASSRTSRLAFIDERIFVLQSEQESLQERRAHLAQREQTLSEQIAELQSSLQTPTSELDQARAQVERYEQELLAIEESRKDIATAHAELAQNLSERRREAEAASKQSTQATLAVDRAGFELQMILEEVQSAYGDEARAVIEEIEPSASDAASIDALRDDVVKLKKRLEREGEVDPDSIERYEEESARLTTLREQAADLQSAVTVLEKTIRRLKELSRERFLETYADVSKRFSELVPRLFGGGAGHMELVNPDDPLTSGVEISVRPPGKKLSSMELLSGGEKALVATAVLVAMFLHRPSPICVLDEVDAPLDEANLQRFISLVSEISNTTQFLMITHNKATMSSMGRLVGITMQERGVSTALSVTLDEAEEELDQWVANA